MATYKNTELGQMQTTLNALNQKHKRKVDKAGRLKSDLKQLRDKALLNELSHSDKVKLSRLEFEHQQVLNEVESLGQERRDLKEVQDQKRALKKKKREEIFNDENPTSKEDDDVFLANMYGIAPAQVAAAADDQVQNEVPFEKL